MMLIKMSERERIKKMQRKRDAEHINKRQWGEKKEQPTKVCKKIKGHTASASAVMIHDHHNWAEVRLRVQRWWIQYAAVHIELVREWKWMKRLLQQQREQDTTASLSAHEREAEDEEGDSRKRRRKKPVSKGRRDDAKPQQRRDTGRGSSGALTLRVKSRLPEFM